MNARDAKNKKTMPKTISPQAMRNKFQNLLQSGKIKKKVTELTLRDEGQQVKEIKVNEFEFGLMPDYSKIGHYSNPNYSYRKHLLNPLAGSGNVDLTLTGATNRSLFVKQSAGGFIFDANTPQWDLNITRYGRDIQSVNQKKFEKVQAKRDAPILAKYINQELGI